MVPADRGYHEIIAHYEDCLARHGDNHRGVDWPRADEAELRYDVMLGIIPAQEPRPVRILDFGCGAGHLLDFIRHRGVPGLEYHGLDLSARFTALCQEKFPGVSFARTDVLETPLEPMAYDYIIINGVFTEKRSLSHGRMWDYARAVLRAVWPSARRGAAFNVMSTHVDWERPDLFHLPLDALMAFLKAELSRHCAIRQDYGLHEYTAYVYREPNR